MLSTDDDRLRLFSSRFIRQREYWIDKFSEPIEPLDLFHPGQTVECQVEELPLDLGESLSATVSLVARNSPLATYVVLVAGLGALLRKYTGRKDIIVGSPTYHLNENSGARSGSVPLRIAVDSARSFRELILSTSHVVMEGYEHQDFALEGLIEHLASSSRLQPGQGFTNIVCAMAEVHTPTQAMTRSRDIVLAFTGGAQRITGVLRYAPGLYERTYVQNFATHFKALLDDALRDMDKPLASIGCLSICGPPGGAAVLMGREQRIPTQPLHARFEEMASDRPDSIAAVCGQEAVSYRELNERSNRLAHFLRERGVLPGARVAILTERSMVMMECILGVWKAGAAYVPLSAVEPRARQSEILADSGSVALLTDSRHWSEDLTEGFDGFAVRHDELVDELRDFPISNPRACWRSLSNLAYVIYTSGSTGKPKGVMVEHLGLANHVQAKVEELAINHTSRVAQIAAATFDISVWQFFSALASGGTTVIYRDAEVLEPEDLAGRLAKDHVTILQVVPSYLPLLLDGLEGRRGKLTLEYLVVTGESINPALVNRCLRTLPSIPVVNAYGPTEASDDVTHHLIHEPTTAARIPVGSPLRNFTLYVATPDMELCPWGVKGEICVSGPGVGRGYVNDPERTARSFVPNPFRNEPGAVLYRTGDIGRVISPGCVEFFGRNDDQVKVRGRRIEIGEIENALCALANVRNAVVVAREDTHAGKYLVAYVVLKAEKQLDSQGIKASLSSSLPGYLVPARVVVLESLPLTTAGKVDRLALLALEAALPQLPVLAMPTDETELELVAIWKEVLGACQVSNLDNFFQLGGHSIAAIQAVSRVNKQLRVRLSLAEIFDHPVLRDLAEVIRSRKAEVQRSSPTGIPVRQQKQRYEISPIQYPEWFLLKLNPGSTFYNIGMLIEFRGVLDVDALLLSLNTLIARHGVLRTSFIEADGKPYQVIHDCVRLTMSDFFADLSVQTDSDASLRSLLAGYYNTPLDLSQPPIVRLKLVKLRADQHVFVFETSHIIWDQLSTFNFTRELQACYNAFRSGSEPNLPVLHIDYADYSEWLNGLIQREELQTQRRYWLNQYRNLPPPLDIPTDCPRPALQTFHGHSIHEYVDPTLRAAVQEYCRANDTTLQMFLVTVLGLLLYRLTGQDDFVVGTPIANRSLQELEPLVGLFASALPLRFQVEAGDTFDTLMRRVRRISVEAYDHHMYPFNKVIEELRPCVDLSRSKIMSVFFGVQNEETEFEDMALKFEGLEASFFMEEEVEQVSQGTSVFDFTLQVDHTVRYMKLSLRYNTDLFRLETASRFLSRYSGLVRQCLENPRLSLSRFSLFCAEDAKAIEDCTQNQRTPPMTQPTIQDWIVDTAGRYPERVAVQAGETAYRYRDLQKDVDRMVRHLRASGLQRGDRVGIFLKRSYEMIYAILGVLHTGGVYVPIGGDTPPSRVREIVSDADLKLIIGAKELVNEGNRSIVEPMLIEPQECEADKDPSGPEVREEVDPDDSAYVLYTSGSTGRPKGVQIRHGAIVNLIHATQEDFRLQCDESVLFNTCIAFDSAIVDIFWPLAVGARIVVAEEGQGRDAREVASYVERHGVNVIQFVPAMLEEFVDARIAGEIGDLPSLRLVNCGGAILSRRLRDKFVRNFQCRLVNNYGTTETTVDVARYDCSCETESEVVPIGKPVANTNIYVLDSFMNICPPGVRGELHISSLGNADGYLNRKELTEQHFVPNVFGDPFSSCLYRTGDLGAYMCDGNIVVYGRLDNQVKINGNRVELDEVEWTLMEHPAIQNAAVILDAESNERLFAFVEVRQGIGTMAYPSTRRYRVFTLDQRPRWGGAWTERFPGETYQRLREEYVYLQMLIVTEEGALTECTCGFPACVVAGEEGEVDVERLAKEAVTGGKGNQEARNCLIVMTSERAGERGAVEQESLVWECIQTLAHQQGFERIIVRNWRGQRWGGVEDRPVGIPYLSESATVEYLEARLPAYMIPRRIVFLEHIPRLASGKNDKASLSRLTLRTAGNGNVVPRSTLEAHLLGTFHEVLATSDMGVHDSFFEKGGHSISALKLLARIERQFGLTVGLPEFYRRPTVAGVAKYLAQRDRGTEM